MFSEFENWLHHQNSQKDLSKESIKVIKFEEEVGTPMNQKDEKEEKRKKDAKVKKVEVDDAQKKTEKVEADERDHDEKQQDQMFKNEALDEDIKHQSKENEEDEDSKYKYDNLFKKSRADIMPKPIVKDNIQKGLFPESMGPLSDKETDSKILNSKEATEDATFKEGSKKKEILEDIEPIKNKAATFKETNIKDERLEDIKPIEDIFSKRNSETSSNENIRRLANLDRGMMNNNQEYENLDRRMSDNRRYAYHPRRNHVLRYQDESYIPRKSYEQQQPRYDSRYIPARQDYNGRYAPGPRYNSQYDQPRRVNYDYLPQYYISDSRQYQNDAM